MAEQFKIAFGRKLDLEKVVVGTLDRRPLHGRDINNISLRELGIPPEKYREAVEEYKRAHILQNPDQDPRRIPLPFFLTFKLPTGQYTIQKGWTLYDSLSEDPSLVFTFDEIDDWGEGSYLLYATFLEPKTSNWNGSWAKEILSSDIEKCLSYRSSVADMINSYGFNFKPEDIKFYLNKTRYNEYKK